MAGTVTVRVLSNRIPGLAGVVKAAVATAVSKAAFDVQAKAQAAAPVRTGTLRRSISTQVGAGGLSAKVGPSVDYGIYVEYGSRGRAGRPYMRPAAEAVRPQFVAGIRSAIAALR